MYYLRCDSEIILVGGQVSCPTTWESVSEEELLGAALSSHQLSQADFSELAAGTIAILATAVGVRVLLGVFFSKR